MKKKWNEKYLPALKQITRFFALYGLIPTLSGAVVGLLIFVQSHGEGKAREIMAQVGDQALSSVLGQVTQKENTPLGFYFLSDELIPPTNPTTLLQAGTTEYFSAENSPKEEQKPDVIYDSLPAGATPIISCDLSSSSYFINTTNYTIDVDAARNAAFPSGTDTKKDEPLVLVLHTHATECYFEDNTNLSDFASDGIDSYFLPESTAFRTEDPEKNMIRVGKVFTDTLNSLGIPTLHCTEMHDREDFNSAYVNSAETVKRYLKEYPSIQYVIDVHRDAVVRNEAYVKSYTVIENQPSAQVMLVVGTGQNGRHPNWEQNLVVATSFKDQMDALYPTLSRSLYLRTSRFNQEYLPGCMLLEVGSAANTLEEAQRAAKYAALSFGEMLKNETK